MKKWTLFVLCSLLYSIGYTQVPRILIDDDLSDWQGTTLAHSDPTGDAGISNIDFRLLWLSHDDNYLFIRFETGAEILFQQNNDIGIYIDTDNDPQTGILVDGIGANIRYFPGDRAGFVHLNNGTSQTVNHFDIGLVSSPTVSGDEFEIAIRRDLIFQGAPLFQGNSIRIAFKDNLFSGDRMPDNDGGIEYNFTGSPEAPLPSYSIERLQANQLRVFSQNVQNDRLFEPFLQDAFKRILQATVPDIITYQEIYDHTSEEAAALIESFLPSNGDQTWYHGKEGPDIILLSRYPILAQAKVPGFNLDQGNGAFLLDLQADYATQLLVINAHLPCCDNNVERQVEIDRLLQFIRQLKEGNGAFELEANTPILITGDMNLVGDRSQQASLIEGNIQNENMFGEDLEPDWDGASFIDAKLYCTDLPMAYTWIRPFSSFSAGRLDYVLYTGSAMELQNGFTLHTPSLSADTLDQYNLQSDDIFNSADHLPMVADFRLLQTTSLSEGPAFSSNEDLQLFQNQPNPFSDQTQIGYQLSKAGDVELVVHDVLGNLILRLPQGRQPAGAYQIELSANAWPAGLYFYTLSSQGQRITRRMVVKQ